MPTPEKIVLIVEDSPTEAGNIRAALADQGLQVLWANDGPSGLKKAREVHPDLIIMDVHMPGMNGFEVVQALKADPAHASIPIVMLTSDEAPGAVMLGLGSGAVDYIPKDVFAMRVLVETLQQMGLIAQKQDSDSLASRKNP